MCIIMFIDTIQKQSNKQQQNVHENSQVFISSTIQITGTIMNNDKLFYSFPIILLNHIH